MYTNLIFDPTETFERLGDIVSLKEEYHELDEAVDYLFELMKSYPTDLSHDRIAAENPYFHTMNYTTFSKFLMLGPLQPDLLYQQISDSISDDGDGIDYKKFFRDTVLEGNANKYNEIDSKSDYKCDAVVALPGGNKLFSNICVNKLKYILEEHGKFVVFKPHPLTTFDELNRLKNTIGPLGNMATIADSKDDLYHYIQKAKIVYTSHCSESALYAKSLDKIISPIDTFQNRQFNSFSHINNTLFMSSNPAIINKIIGSYKSGLILPSLQKDWKYRIKSYLEYIHEMRSKVRYHYV